MCGRSAPENGGLVVPYFSKKGMSMFENNPLFSMENIYRAYLRCRRRKRGTLNALRFEHDLEENLVALHEELTSGNYRPGSSMAFLVRKPKQREIFAADFRDRVVHHILVGHLEPKWESRFIHDSYACRKGKGTHAGVERVRSFARKVTANGTRVAWYLQLDVRGYFITLDRKLLYERISHKERCPAVLWLLRTLIFHEPTAACRMRGARRADFERLPAHKTLFKADPDCGLPIGNLTSQFFANVYLDALDQFVKHALKVRLYVRYCDDLVLLSHDRAQLEEWQKQIELFMGQRLKLALNERRRLRPVSDGIDFLGYVVRPHYLLVRKRVVSALKERLTETESSLRRMGMMEGGEGREVFVWNETLIEEVRQWLNSYLAHLNRASCRSLLCSVLSRFPWLKEYFTWDDGKVILRCPTPRHALRFSQQQRYFQQRFPEHLVVMQVGAFWQVLAGRKCEPSFTDKHFSILSQRFHSRHAEKVGRVLWRTGLPVAWVGETGRRTGIIAERTMIYRWSTGL
jgi:RNA-directed DNA polymerase